MPLLDGGHQGLVAAGGVQLGDGAVEPGLPVGDVALHLGVDAGDLAVRRGGGEHPHQHGGRRDPQPQGRAGDHARGDHLLAACKDEGLHLPAGADVEMTFGKQLFERAAKARQACHAFR
jgi:hypothetical protein